MRYVLAIPVAVLFAIGVGFLWAGWELGYKAIDPDAYRDSRPSTYLLVGGMFAVLGLVILAGGVALIADLVGHVVPLRAAVVAFVFGLLPHSLLLGSGAIAINLVLLTVGGLLLLVRRLARVSPIS